MLQHGAGKSLLLAIASGLVPPSRGEVVFRGRRIADLPSSPPKLGFVFEDDGGLLANLSVFDNVALPLRFHFALSEAEIDAKVREALGLVGLEEDAGRMPWQLTSDRQRLASLARASVHEPELVFIDDFYLNADQDAFRRLQDSVARRTAPRSCSRSTAAVSSGSRIASASSIWVRCSGSNDRAERASSPERHDERSSRTWGASVRYPRPP